MSDEIKTPPAAADETKTTVDITPTWTSLLPALVEVAANGGSVEGRRTAMEELYRMARAMDAAVESARVARESAEAEAARPKGLTRDDWQSAMDVQNACNLSGVVHSLSRLLPRVREEADYSGTPYVNHHPIVILYLDKLMDLARLDTGTDAYQFSKAYEAVSAKLAGFKG